MRIFIRAHTVGFWLAIVFQCPRHARGAEGLSYVPMPVHVTPARVIGGEWQYVL